MDTRTLKVEKKQLSGTVYLPASKSIANRLLVINALAGNTLTIHNLSDANDTKVLHEILASLPLPSSQPVEINCHDAGTAMRFLTAYFAGTTGQWLLKGTDRMHQRPISILVDKLIELGADIKYVGANGFPPLLITGKKLIGGSITINASVSSQYISALMMIAPHLQNGLTINLEGKISSQPYIQMTAGLMQQCGAGVTISGSTITIAKADYTPAEITVESDWSAASYWYALLAACGGEIKLQGLHSDSLQGDSVVAQLMSGLVNTRFDESGAILKRTEIKGEYFTHDFSNCPDLAPTFIALCGALGMAAKFTGLESLSIKESDRTAALATELAKLNIRFEQTADYWQLIPNPHLQSITEIPVFDTYNDHRLAMALSIFSCVLSEIKINNPQVVTKSYPTFWEDFKTLLA